MCGFTQSEDNVEVAPVIVGLGGVAVAVESDCALVHELLAEFYPVEPDLSGPMWTVVAHAQAPPRGVAVNRFGVGYQPDIAGRSLTLWATQVKDLAITTRKCVREIFLDACERTGYGMLHASAVYRDDQAIVFAADKRGGKTTLALRAVLDHGWRWLSNDHLIVWRGEAGLVATSLPTPIPLKVGTYLDLIDRLPPPWDTNGVDAAGWRAAAPAARYASDVAVYYTFGRLGQPNPVLVELVGRRLTVVFPSYAGPGQREGVVDTVPAQAAAAELAGHVRADWIGDQRLHQRHLPFPHRDVAAFSRDGVNLAAQVAAAVAEVVRFTHRGDPSPLLVSNAEAAAR